MKTDSADLDKQQLLQLVNSEYGLQLTSISFVPRGEEAFTYIGQTAAGERCFIRVQPAAAATALADAYPISYALQHQHGLAEVVAPCRTRRQALVVPLHDYLLAVFPYIDGTTLHQQVPSEPDITAAAALLARVHQAPLSLPGLRREQFVNPFRAPILRALEAAHAPSSASGPLQRQVCALLRVEQAEILKTLEHMDQLGALARGLASDWVLTHGDPNRDNVIKDQHARLHLTDWGAVASGPAERDLTFWTGETFELFLEAYARRRPGTRLHPRLFEFYFYRWCVQEIADYATRILFEDPGPVEREHAWAELRDYLPIQHQALAVGVQEVARVLQRVAG